MMAWPAFAAGQTAARFSIRTCSGERARLLADLWDICCESTGKGLATAQHFNARFGGKCSTGHWLGSERKNLAEQAFPPATPADPRFGLSSVA
jgi:hypothetical protein